MLEVVEEGQIVIAVAGLEQMVVILGVNTVGTMICSVPIAIGVVRVAILQSTAL